MIQMKDEKGFSNFFITKEEVDRYPQARVLTYKEYDFLSFLIQSKGELLRYDYLLENVWGKSSLRARRSMNVYAVRLRNIFKNIGLKETIYCVHGRGIILK